MNHEIKPNWFAPVSVIAGLILLFAILILAIFIPKPTEFQVFVFRVIIALAAAAFGATIPGFLKLNLPIWGQGLIAAGGALALFVVIFNINPPNLITNSTDLMTDNSQEIIFNRDVVDHSFEDIREQELINWDLEELNFSNAILAHSDLSNSWISRSNFSRANLSSVNFSNVEGYTVRFDDAGLFGANFTESILIGSSFRGADLSEAQFYGASLREVDFTNSNLKDTRFHGADITGADFSGAKNLTKEQLKVAKIDTSFHRPVKLPDGF